MRWLFVLLSIGLFSFHIYWAHYAAEQNEKFQDLSYKDLRVRRLSESTLRGWVFDRSGRVDQPLAYYKRDSSGNIQREYPMDKALAHLFGSDRGDPGLERALFGVQSGALPEALEVVKGQAVEFRGNQDVRLTIDRALQQAAVDQLKGKHGAVVILNPQNGDVLAMYSEPSYSLAEVNDEATWIRLEANERDKPLVSRALGAYYIPGSTFKTVTMIAAFLAGEQDTEFTCSGGGYYASPGANVIFDDAGPAEVHGRIKIDHAYEVSCNQYFAQMGVKLGQERLKRAAQLLGIGAYDTPSEALRGRKLPEIWNGSTDAVKRALAPREATIVTGKQVTRYDLALIGYGQGYAGQMTPLQMALSAAAIGNMEGKLMKPKIEYNVAAAAVQSGVDATGCRATAFDHGTRHWWREWYGAWRVWSSQGGGHQHRWQDRHGAESSSRLRSKNWRAKDASQSRARQSRQHHSRIRRDHHGQREPENRRLVSLHRAARETTTRDGGDRRGRRLRIAIRSPDRRGARFESEGPWIFQIRRFPAKAQRRKERDNEICFRFPLRLCAFAGEISPEE